MATTTKKKPKASKDARKTHGAEKKGDIFYIDPDKLKLVTDSTSDAYDKRVHDKVTEKFIRNIMSVGVHTPIKVRRNLETMETEVAFGRKRTLALREVNRRLRERGDEPRLMPCVVLRAVKGADLLGMIISENEHRTADTLSNKIAKAARMLDFGATYEQVGDSFGLEVAQVKNLISLAEAPPFILNAVDAEKVTLTHGVKAAKVFLKEGPDAARKIIDKLIELAPRTPGKKRSPNSRKAQEIANGGPVMLGKKAIVELKRMAAAQAPAAEREAWVAALACVLGEAEAPSWSRVQLEILDAAPAAASGA